MSLIDRITPLADMVLVRRIPDDETTKGGIIIPEVARNRPRGPECWVGEVLAVGRGDLLKFKRMADISPDADLNWPTGTVHFKRENGVTEDDYHSIRVNMHTRVGDRILYKRCPDNDVVIDGETLTLLREEQHVLAVMEP